MKRWNIKNIILYNKGQERKIIDFNLTGITIITGKSRTGKSVITEIIDYALGSSQCHFPLIIKETCSWVGILLKKNETEMLILRKVPVEMKKTSTDFYLKKGKSIVIPQNKDELIKTMSLDEAKAKLESTFKIREIDNSFFENDYKENKKITIRNVMPYLLQDDDIIISKSNIFRGLNTEKRQSILDSAPYFLGAVNEDFVQKKSELTKLKKELAILQKKIETKKTWEEEKYAKAHALLFEAKQVGLFYGELQHKDYLKEVLDEIIYNNIDVNSEEVNLVNDLYDQLKDIEKKISLIKDEIELTESNLESANIFEEISLKQKSKFINLGISKCIKYEDSCPLCGGKTESLTETLLNIKRHTEEINNEIIGVEVERPKLDNYLLNLKETYELYKRDRNTINDTLKTLVKEKDNEHLLLKDRQNKLKGKIEYFLDNIWKASNYFDEEILASELENKVNMLTEEISFESIKERIEDIRIRINTYAFEIIKSLPLEDKYQNCPLDLNLSTMTAGILTKYGKIVMRDVGSDLNYLCLHVAILLAIHRHFDDMEREYPGFLVFDQLSRPFFPPDPKNNNELDEIVIAAENEKKELKQFFDYLFEEAEKNKSLQIIIYEHAYYAKDDRYVKATKYRWNEEGLIPESWKI